MEAKNMNGALAEFLKREYPQTKAYLFSAFIE